MPDKTTIGGMLDIGVDSIHVRMVVARIKPLRAAATDFNYFPKRSDEELELKKIGIIICARYRN